jgi:aspartate racemase
MTKHIGIVGVSYEGAALCYRTIFQEARDWLGPFQNPEITMHNLNWARYHFPSGANEWDTVSEAILESANKLARIGADFLVCPDNTVHVSIDPIIDRSPLPWLHIAEEVAREAKAKGYKNVGLLGTQPLMEGPVYGPQFEKYGIQYQTPELAARQQVHKYIVDELVYGDMLPATRVYFQTLIEQFAANGCDAVALSCTEIPLLISPEDSALPVLDSTRLLARAALREAVKQ